VHALPPFARPVFTSWWLTPAAAAGQFDGLNELGEIDWFDHVRIHAQVIGTQ
jgi:hypothetical protein